MPECILQQMQRRSAYHTVCAYVFVCVDVSEYVCVTTYGHWQLASYEMHRISFLFYAFRGKFMLCMMSSRVELRAESRRNEMEQASVQGNNICNIPEQKSMTRKLHHYVPLLLPKIECNFRKLFSIYLAGKQTKRQTEIENLQVLEKAGENIIDL